MLPENGSQFDFGVQVLHFEILNSKGASASCATRYVVLQVPFACYITTIVVVPDK